MCEQFARSCYVKVKTANS